MSGQMRAKDFMSQALYADQQINSKIEQVMFLHELTGKASVTLTNMKVTGTRNIHCMEDVIIKTAELKDETNAEKEILIELKQEISRVVNRMENPACHMLLSLRYLDFKTWKQAAAEMNYSIRYVRRIHSTALEAVEVILCHDRARWSNWEL
jgi:DNA-directed RNA polymerase specialized sigma subunit